MTYNKINFMLYIGKCEYHRKNNWEKYLGSGVYLKKAIKKYGCENFERIILDEADSKSELELLEEEYLKFFNVVESPRFYNLKYTSIGGDTFTNHPNKELIRIKKSKNSKGKNNARYNSEYTLETRLKISKANSRAIIVDGVEYPSITDYSNKSGINITTISHRLCSETFENFRYKESRIKNKNIDKSNQTNKKKPIIIDGVPYDSLSDAVKSLGRSKPYIKFRLNSDDFPNYRYI